MATSKPKKAKKISKQAAVHKWFSYINSTNYAELAKSFEQHLAAHGYQIEEVK